MNGPVANMIWITGTQEGTNVLLRKFAQQIGITTQFPPKSTTFFVWADTRFRICPGQKGFVILVDSDKENNKLALYLHNLNQLYISIIEPLKDITGGVAAGIDYCKAAYDS